MSFEEDFSEKIKRHLYEAVDDWGKFFISGLLIFFGGRKFSREISDLSEAASEGSEVATRATWRLFNYNVVGWIVRPLLSTVLVVQTLLFALGIAPIVALRYTWMTLILGLLCMPLFGWLFLRRIRLTFDVSVGWSRRRIPWIHKRFPLILIRSSGIKPITSLEDLKAENSVFIQKHGPDGRFSIKDLIGLPIPSFCIGALTIFVAMLTKHFYNTSVIIVWTSGFFGLLSIGFAFLQFKFILGLVKMAVGGPLDWIEKVLVRLGKSFIDVPIPFLTKSDVEELLSGSFIEKLKTGIEDFEAACKRYLVPVELVLAFGAITMCLWLTALVALIFAGYAYVVSAFMGTGDDGLTKTAKTNPIWATRMVGGSLLLTMLVYRIVEAIMFGLHAVPSFDSVPILFAQVVNAIKASYILLLIVFFALVMAIKRLDMVKKMEESHITLTKIVRGILIGTAIVLLMFIWSPWTGVKLTMQDTYWRRFEHPHNEALHCLNGEQDFDEKYTDMGQSCGPYRRVYGDPDRLIAARSPLTYEESACGNPLQCGLEWVKELANEESARSQSAMAQEAEPEIQATPIAPASPPPSIPASVASGRPVTLSLRPDKAAARELYRPFIEQASRVHGVDANLIRAMIQVESDYNPRAVSSTGCRGLMQLCFAAAERVGVTDRFDPEQSIMGGTAYYRRKLDQHGSQRLALAAYRVGSGNLRAGSEDFATGLSYADRVTRLQQAYQSGYSPESGGSYRRQVASPSQEVENEPRQVAVADSSVNAIACANLSESIQEIMRRRGRCP